MCIDAPQIQLLLTFGLKRGRSIPTRPAGPSSHFLLGVGNTKRGGGGSCYLTSPLSSSLLLLLFLFFLPFSLHKPLFSLFSLKLRRRKDNMAAATGGLPLVPLSPLTKSALAYSDALAQAKEKLSEAKQANPPVPVGTLRRLIEDTRVERSRLDTVVRQIQSVQGATAFKWDPDTIARQIAAINCQLYSNVALERNWLCQLDVKQSNLVPVLDFHRYLTHSFAHQLIYWSELLQNGASAAAVEPAVHPKDNLITHLVRVAYLLAHGYRDFSGFAAVMRALMLPEVRRLRKLWQNCSSRTRELYKELSHIMSPADNHQAYHDLLRKKLETFHSKIQSPATIAVPWIQPHLASVRSIVTAYTAGDQDPDSVKATGEIILSAPGARKLSLLIATLELCQRNATDESADLIEELAQNSKASSKRMSAILKPIQLEGLRSSVSPLLDLGRLLPGEPVAQHWLLSRVYLTKAQLIEESTLVEPLAPGERLESDGAEEEEEQRLELDIARANEALELLRSLPPTPLASNSRRGSLSLNPDPEQADELAQNDRKDDNNNSSSTNDNDNDDDNDDDDNNNNGDVAAKEQENKKVKDQTSEEHIQPAKELTEEHIQQHNRQKSATDHSLTTSQSSSSQQGSHASKQTKKSRLSPTAPEFIPSSKITQPLLAPLLTTPSAVSVSEGMPSSVVVSPASSIQQVNGLEPLQGVAEEEEEDPEEQWHGYPVANTNADDGETDSEVWHGYPTPPSEAKDAETTNADADMRVRRDSLQSEESEEWKGYHASKMEATWQMEIDMKVKNHDWQGYTLETSNDDELDSSTLMNGEFEKSRQARQGDPLDSFRQRLMDQNAAAQDNSNNRWAPQLST